MYYFQRAQLSHRPSPLLWSLIVLNRPTRTEEVSVLCLYLISHASKCVAPSQSCPQRCVRPRAYQDLEKIVLNYKTVGLEAKYQYISRTLVNGEYPRFICCLPWEQIIKQKIFKNYNTSLKCQTACMAIINSEETDTQYWQFYRQRIKIIFTLKICCRHLFFFFTLIAYSCLEHQLFSFRFHLHSHQGIHKV